MKRVLALLLSLVMVFGMVACSSASTTEDQKETETDAAETAQTGDTGDTGESGDGHYTMGCVIIDSTNPHCAAFGDAFVETVEARGDTAILLDAGGSAETMINCLSDLKSKGVDGIVLESTDATAPLSILQEIKDAGIVVAASDLYLETTEEDDLVISQTVSKNYEAGVACAEALIEKAGDAETNVLVLEKQQDTSAMQRVQGFLDTIEGHDNIVLLEEGQAIEDTVEAKLELAEVWVQKYDKIDAVFCYQDVSALACIQALKAANRLDGVLVYGVDGTPDAIAAVASGEMEGTAKQQPEQLAIASTEDVYTYLETGKIDHDWNSYVDVVYVDASNVAEYQ